MKTRLAVALGAGIASSSVGTLVGRAEGALIGIAIAGVVFVTFGWTVLWRLTWQETKAFAGSQDPGRTTDELMVVGVAVASLSGIAAFLVGGGSSSSSDTWAAAVAVVGVAMAWASLHLMYAARYAKLYYGLNVDKPIDFNSDEPPAYRDFLYFSYNLGMTYQVSDTSVGSSEIRSVVLGHCLLSYVFGTAILASTINLVLGVLAG